MKLEERSAQNFKTSPLSFHGRRVWLAGCRSLHINYPCLPAALLRASIANTHTSAAWQSFQQADRDREKRTGGRTDGRWQGSNRWQEQAGNFGVEFDTRSKG